MILPYYEVHEGGGPPMLMVHGILSSRAQWQRNLEALRTVCSSVILELYGHGRSPAPPDPGPYHPAGYIEAFESIRRRLGVDRWFVCGYSLGAGLTIRYGMEHPEAVIAGIFTNSTSAFADRSQATRYRDEGEGVIKRFEEGGRAAIEAIPVHPRFAKRLPSDVKRALLEDCELLDPGGVGRTIVYTSGNSSVRGMLDQNTIPALLICGSKEKRFEPLRRYVEVHMPHLETAELAAGHAVNAEDPDGFNRAAVQFLTGAGQAA